MRKPFSILMLVIVVAMSFVVGCGGDDSTAPQNNAPPTFSKMMGTSGDAVSVNALVVLNDGTSVVEGEANVLSITGSATPLDGTGTSDDFFVGFKPDGSIAFRTFVAGSGVPSIRTMSRDANNNLLVTGSFTHDVTFGTTNLTHNTVQDVFMAKLDATAHPIWVQGAGGSGDDEGVDIAAASDGSVYVCGLVTGEVAVAGEDTGIIGKQSGYLVKMRPDGGGIWQQTAAPAGSALCTGVAVSQNGSVVVCGAYTGANVEIGGVILPNDGVENGFVARFDAAGNPLGNIRLGGTGAVNMTGLKTIGDEVVVAGSFSGTVDFDVNTAAGVVAAVATDAFVARYSKTGQFQWVKTFGTSGDQAATELARTSSGDILVGGTFDNSFTAGSTVLTTSGHTDTFIVRLSGGGQVLAVKRVAGIQDEVPTGIASFNDSVLLVGNTNSTEVTLPDGTKRTPFGSADGFIYQQP